jgi:hypothetical protein
MGSSVLENQLTKYLNALLTSSNYSLLDMYVLLIELSKTK